MEWSKIAGFNPLYTDHIKRKTGGDKLYPASGWNYRRAGTSPAPTEASAISWVYKQSQVN